MESTRAKAVEIYREVADAIEPHLLGTLEERQIVISTLFVLVEMLAAGQRPDIRNHWAARAYSVGDQLTAPGESQWTH